MRDELVFTAENSSRFISEMENLFANVWHRLFTLKPATDAGRDRNEFYVAYNTSFFLGYSTADRVRGIIGDKLRGLYRREGVKHASQEIRALVDHFEQYYLTEIKLGNGHLYMSSMAQSVLAKLACGTPMIKIAHEHGYKSTSYVKTLRDNYLDAYKKVLRIENGETYSQVMADAINHSAPELSPYQWNKKHAK